MQVLLKTLLPPARRSATTPTAQPECGAEQTYDPDQRFVLYEQRERRHDGQHSGKDADEAGDQPFEGAQALVGGVKKSNARAAPA